MKKMMLCLALMTATAANAETTTPLTCGKLLGFKSKAVLTVGRMEPNDASVYIDFNKAPPLKKRISALKECLKVASSKYQGINNIYGGVTVGGVDDTELAETLSIFYDQKSKSVKTEQHEGEPG